MRLILTRRHRLDARGFEDIARISVLGAGAGRLVQAGNCLNRPIALALGKLSATIPKGIKSQHYRKE